MADHDNQEVHEYDVVVVGSGSGNSLINHEWRDKKAAIIDGGVFGGTCLNRGCIPTKMFAYPATTARHGLEIDALGVTMERQQVRWREIRDRIFGRIDAISESGKEYREGLENVDLYSEYATFQDPHTLVTASGQRVRGRHVVIAAGSRAVRPNIPGIDLPGVHTSDTIMRIEELPKRVVIVGGGFIAAEFAGIFSGLGSEVIQANRSERVLREHDADVATRFAEVAGQQWDVRLNTGIDAIEQVDGALSVTLREGNSTTTETADVVLVATGRVSNVDSLGAESVGLDVDNGVLSVDEYQRVLSGGQPVPGLWALGDVSSEIQLKHLANAQERTVQHNIHHPEDLRSTDQRFVPHAVFTNPQIAAVGLTESEAREKAQTEGFEISVKIQDFGDVAYGWAMEDHVGFVKLVARKDTGELLGAHLIGTESSMLIQPLIQAMSFGLTAHEMARGQFWIHPALTEVVENALLGLDVPGN
ncbi:MULTISPECIES: mycothione reductase [Kocuria]|uniref:mycothione reductase n=1 Tax=Kocuria TaxID=57493 RepID=UPI00066078C2|nr:MULTISPECIES: mycothione reductase [Kocuria]RUQ20467.1 mycothione reductase [Kocuria sp. HSID16901]